MFLCHFLGNIIEIWLGISIFTDENPHDPLPLYLYIVKIENFHPVLTLSLSSDREFFVAHTQKRMQNLNCWGDFSFFPGCVQWTILYTTCTPLENNRKRWCQERDTGSESSWLQLCNRMDIITQPTLLLRVWVTAEGNVVRYIEDKSDRMQIFPWLHHLPAKRFLFGWCFLPDAWYKYYPGSGNYRRNCGVSIHSILSISSKLVMITKKIIEYIEVIENVSYLSNLSIIPRSWICMLDRCPALAWQMLSITACQMLRAVWQQWSSIYQANTKQSTNAWNLLDRRLIVACQAAYQASVTQMPDIW